eukprot:TRINITY_DN2614_c0_g1_i1.p2 TRINITY_DN2614_c0_g1~~TRINITY_DN2614_c0_g1_i1.p2  ORF type:complete len:104 (-),score=2.56 TRINITY_DN2614_c0_g1_i1:243-554(-)
MPYELGRCSRAAEGAAGVYEIRFFEDVGGCRVDEVVFKDMTGRGPKGSKYAEYCLGYDCQHRGQHVTCSPQSNSGRKADTPEMVKQKLRAAQKRTHQLEKQND